MEPRGNGSTELTALLLSVRNSFRVSSDANAASIPPSPILPTQHAQNQQQEESTLDSTDAQPDHRINIENTNNDVVINTNPAPNNTDAFPSLTDSNNSRLLALQGACSVLYGIAALSFPALTLALFTAMFASFALLFGALSLSSLLNRRPFSRAWWQLMSEGLVSVLAGAYALVSPDRTALFVLYLVAGWALVSGFSQFTSVIWTRGQARGEEFGGGALGTASEVMNALSLLALGVFLFANASSRGLLALVWVIALQAIINGIFMLLGAAAVLHVKWKNSQTISRQSQSRAFAPASPRSQQHSTTTA